MLGFGQLSMGLRPRRPSVSPLTDWNTVSYTFTTGSFVNNSGTLTANANYRYVKVPVQSFWQGVRASGTINIGSPNHWVLFLNNSNQVLGSYITGTGGSLPLSSTGNGVIPWPLPAGTTQIAFNSRTTDTALSIQAKTSRVLVIGDSTSISGGTGIGDDLASLYSTRTFYQQGIAGQLWMGHIRNRMGVYTGTISVTGGQIPTSGTVACTPSTGFLNHTSSDVVVKVDVAGIRCALRFIFSSGTYTLQALDPISAPVTVPNNTVINVLSGIVVGVGGDVSTCPPLIDMLNGTLWIVRSAPSINDRFTVNYTNMQTAVDDLVTYARRWNSKLVLVGMMNGEKDLPSGTYTGGTASSASQSAGFLNYVATMNTYMSNKAAENSSFVKFIDAQANHVANGGATTENINGTNYQVLTSTAATPKLSDYRHENTAAQASTANLIKTSLDTLGW